MNITILDETRNTVRDIFAEVTRYPLDILDPAASLEEDLGIDSVKLGEIFSVLREKYDLPKEINIPTEKLRTISGISEALQEYLATRSGANQAVVPRLGLTTVQSAKPAAANSAVDRKTVQESVLKVFAEVTRYPLDILDPAASLEEDLGIDSVKLGEIFSVLREKYDLPKEINIPAEKLRTISGISEALQEYLVGRNH